MKYLILPFLLVFGLLGQAQTYTPSAHVPVNKALGIAQATPTDARSYFYDGVAFTYRPYNSTAEVLSYLNTTTKRSGNFPIYVNIGGIRKMYMFLNGTADADLKEIVMLQPSDTARLVAIDSLQVLTDSTFRTQKNGVWTTHTIRGAAVGGGEANTASNVGSGAVLFKQKTGVNLEFKSVTTDTTLVPTQNANDLNLKVDQSRMASVKRLADTAQSLRSTMAALDTSYVKNQGAGVELTFTDGDTLKVKRIQAGSNIAITRNADSSLTLSATGGGGGSQSLQSVLGIGSRKSITIIDTNSLNQHVGWYGEPNNFGTSYGVRGNAGKFGGFGWSRHDVNASGRPNVVGMAFGYNVTPDGGRIDLGEASARYALETHYEMNGGKNYFEMHWPEFIDKGGVGHRPWSAYIEKEGTGWAWSAEGSGISFSKWNDQNTTWGYFSPGEVQSYQYTKNVPSWPKLRIGAMTDSINGQPWASKYNFELTVENQYAYIGRRGAVAADNAQINVVDNLLVGSAGAANRRGFAVYGATSLVDGETYIDNAAGGTRSLSVWFNNVRRLEIGSSLIQFYNVPIYHDKSIFSLEAFKAGGGSYIPWGENILELESTTKTTKFPILTTATRNGFSGVGTAALHYNSDSSSFEFKDASSWQTIPSRNWVRTMTHQSATSNDTYVLVKGASDSLVKQKAYDLTSGTYTPTITNNTNIGTSSISVCNYLRHGDYIEVFGEVTIDPTATGDTQLTIDLPIASGIANSYELSGSGVNYDNNQVIRIYSVASQAVFRLNASVDASSHVYSFRFIYKYTAP